MTEKQIIAREVELQGYIRMHPRLNLEFKAMMSRLLREHRIDVSPETLSRMTIALDRTGAEMEPASTPAKAESHNPFESAPELDVEKNEAPDVQDAPTQNPDSEL